MKLYFNLDLDVLKMNEILKNYAEISLEDANYIRCGRLNTKENIADFLTQLNGDKEVSFYDYETLELTLAEFKKLHEALVENDIVLLFVNEQELFYDTIVSVMETESRILSKRINYAIEMARKEGKVFGRPRLDNEVQDRIYYLYTKKKMSMRQIAKSCGVSLGTVHKYVNASASEKSSRPQKEQSVET